MNVNKGQGMGTKDSRQGMRGESTREPAYNVEREPGAHGFIRLRLLK
jgi:hypothetical protein